jgi:hypothetical protein
VPANSGQREHAVAFSAPEIGPGIRTHYRPAKTSRKRPAGLRIETRNPRLGSHFADKFAEILHPESVNPA